MGKITYTKSQETAIQYKGGNLLLSAAAGSGKTATLTARILRLILEGDENGEVNLTDMLVVTYTRAAANELRGKITAAILEAEREWRNGSAEARPAISGGRFFRHITDAQRADISTIHAFLYKVLRPYLPTLGLTPDMSIVDESAANVMKAAAMQDVIDDFFDRQTEAVADKAAFTELADAFGAARDAAALDTVFIDMADKLVAVGRDETCLYNYADVLDTDADRGFFKSVYGEYIKDHIRLMFSHYRSVLSELSDSLIAEGGKPAVQYLPELNSILSVIGEGSKALDEGAYAVCREIIAGYKQGRLGTVGAKDKTETSEYFKTVRARFKKDMAAAAEDYFMADEASLTLSMKRTARILRMLGDVLGAYYRAFAKRKRAQNALDYADLELYALKLFLDENGDPTDAAREVGERYKYIFIDEYQDTNHVQDSIFRAISGKSVRFMVGDIKQSIYRFRGAEPEVFSGYRDRFPVLRSDEAAEGAFSHDEGRCVFMSENFRCDEAVVRFVNMISAYMFPYGGIPYTADDALICGKGGGKTEQNPVEICLIEKPIQRKSAEEEDTSHWDNAFNPEAEYVADRIAAMIGTVLIDGDHPCRAGDIAILTRTYKGTAEVYAEALMRRGIRVRLKTGTTPLSAKSAKLVMCILNLVDNPLREIYAAGAMRSPVFGFTTDDIVLLKRFGGELPLYMAVTKAAALSDSAAADGYSFETETDEENGAAEMPSPMLLEKCVKLAAWVKRHKNMARGMKADKYLEFLYSELELSSFPEIFRDGAERNALNRLYESARRYESGRFGGLSGFIDYMNENAETETAEIGEEDAVSIVSIHSSKGLEYPVCFLVECGKKRNKADEEKKLLFDPALGFGMTLPDEGGLVRCDTAVRCGIAEKKRVDAIHEEMRLLYVALTRARSRLIVTAKTTNAEELLGNAERDKEFFTPWSVRECDTYRDMIIRGAARMGAQDFYETKVISLASIHPFLPDGAETEDAAIPETAESKEIPVLDFEENFRFRYPLAFLSKVPAKLAVSDLGPDLLDDGETASVSFSITEEHTADDGEERETAAVPLPQFMSGISEVKGADKGSATHLFMQFMDLERLAREGVDAELDRLVRERFLSQTEADMVERRHLKRFAESGLFRRMLCSEMIRREFRFNVRMEAEKFTADAQLAEMLRTNGVRVTVQGVVDCVFRGEKGLVLVDYKTDAMSREEYANPRLGEEKLIQRHKNQLMYYKEICERLFGEAITETLIYSTTLGKAVSVEL